MRKKIILAIFILLCGGLAFLYLHNRSANNGKQTSGTTAPTETTNKQTKFDKSAYSLSDPASIWIVVNKRRPLKPQTYIPADLVLPNVSQRVPGAEEMKMRAAAAAALEKMFAGATQQNLKLQITTAYRSYSYQNNLYDGYVKASGKASADSQSARPGYSEHQTGLAVDIRPQSGNCYLDPCFSQTPEGTWLAAHAYEYGFILRYPKDKQSVTGYVFEPWHFRFVGTSLANEMHTEKITTLEEFFGLGDAPDYQG